MLIDRVLFRYGDVSEIITLESIEQHRDYILLLEHLYCVTPNCRCKMTYIPKGKRAAHFKKWVGGQHQHSRQCPYYYALDMDDRSKRVGDSVANLNDKHISDVHKRALNKFFETEDERKLRLAKGRARRQRNLFIKKIEELFPVSIFAGNLAIGIMGRPIVEGDKTPDVKTRGSILEFSNEDIGWTQATAGYFKSIVFNEKVITITITDQQKHNLFHLYFDEVFLANFGEGARRMLEELEVVLGTQEDVVITCIGEVVKKEGKIGMCIIGPSDLLINGYQIPNFLFEMDSIFNYIN